MNCDECLADQRLPPQPHHCRRLVVTVSLAIGAHAALNKRALDAAKAIASEPGKTVASRGRGRAGDRQRSLSRRQCAAGAADQRCPRADRNAAQERLRRRHRRGRQQGRHAPRRRPSAIQGQARYRGDAVLRRLRRAGRPRELHDPGRCQDLEGSRRAARRRQRRIRARGDPGKGRPRQAGRGRRLPAQSL